MSPGAAQNGSEAISAHVDSAGGEVIVSRPSSHLSLKVAAYAEPANKILAKACPSRFYRGLNPSTAAELP